MQRRRFLSHFLGGFAGVAACGMAGCGTLLHSERQGRPHSNQIDWKVAALDALGLLLFFVPGVVAFVVDFSTGAIYLPLEPSFPEYEVPPPQHVGPGSWQQVPQQQARILRPAEASSVAHGQCRPVWRQYGLTRVVIPRDQLQPRRIEQVATLHVRRPVVLDDSQTRLSELPSIAQYEEQTNRHRSDRHFGFPVQALLDRLKRGIV